MKPSRPRADAVHKAARVIRRVEFVKVLLHSDSSLEFVGLEIPARLAMNISVLEGRGIGSWSRTRSRIVRRRLDFGSVVGFAFTTFFVEFLVLVVVDVAVADLLMFKIQRYPLL
ncbi:MAG: hypothetical protein AB7P49_00660 [Bdellovibrionales bacterium]